MIDAGSSILLFNSVGQNFNVVWEQIVIVVAERHKGRGAFSDAGVSCNAHARVRDVQPGENEIAGCPFLGGGVIFRAAIIDDDDFPWKLGLMLDGLEQPNQLFGPIKGRGDNADGVRVSHLEVLPTYFCQAQDAQEVLPSRLFARMQDIRAMGSNKKPDYKGGWKILDKFGLAQPVQEAIGTWTWIRKQKRSGVNMPQLYLNWGWRAWVDRQWYSDFIENSPRLRGRKFVFFGPFGARWRASIPFRRPKVFLTQEDTKWRFPQYDDYLAGTVDLSLGFKPDDAGLHRMFFPIWFEWFIRPDLSFDQTETPSNGPWSPKQFVAEIERWDGSDDRDSFCALIASHDNRGNGKGLRTLAKELMEGLGDVQCAGKLHRNTSALQEDFHDEIVPFLRTCRFNICFENVSSEGYVTEKLFQAFLAGSIPVYWSFDESPVPEFLTGNGIVFFDPSAPEKAMELVAKLSQDPVFRSDWMGEPKFHVGAAEKLEQRMSMLEERLYEVSQRR